jgi:hypothetical protein
MIARKDLVNTLQGPDRKSAAPGSCKLFMQPLEAENGKIVKVRRPVAH